MHGLNSRCKQVGCDQILPNGGARVDPERELLNKMGEDKDFFRRLFTDDCADDWSLVESGGRFLVRIDAQSTVGYFMIARACRHLAKPHEHAEAVKQCRRLLESAGVTEAEREALLLALSVEERALSDYRKG